MQEPLTIPKYEQVGNLSSNDLTLRSYELGAQEYINGTAAEASGSFKDWIESCQQINDRQRCSIHPIHENWNAFKDKGSLFAQT